MDDGVSVLKLGASQKRRVARDVGGAGSPVGFADPVAQGHGTRSHGSGSPSLSRDRLAGAGGSLTSQRSRVGCRPSKRTSKRPLDLSIVASRGPGGQAVRESGRGVSETANRRITAAGKAPAARVNPAKTPPGEIERPERPRGGRSHAASGGASAAQQHPHEQAEQQRLGRDREAPGPAVLEQRFAVDRWDRDDPDKQADAVRRRQERESERGSTTSDRCIHGQSLPWQSHLEPGLCDTLA